SAKTSGSPVVAESRSATSRSSVRAGSSARAAASAPRASVKARGAACRRETWSLKESLRAPVFSWERRARQARGGSCARTRSGMKLATAAIVVGIIAALAGCSSEELAGAPDGLDPAHVRTVHGHGFAVVDDGSLEPAEETALFQELGDARAKILAFLKKGAA